MSANNPPCSGRLRLFEPFRLPNERDSERAERMRLAQEVCSRCPLLDKATCLIKAKEEGALTRGVWGGKVITESNRKGQKIDIRLR